MIYSALAAIAILVPITSATNTCAGVFHSSGEPIAPLDTCIGTGTGSGTTGTGFKYACSGTTLTVKTHNTSDCSDEGTIGTLAHKACTGVNKAIAGCTCTDAGSACQFMKAMDKGNTNTGACDPNVWQEHYAAFGVCHTVTGTGVGSAIAANTCPTAPDHDLTKTYYSDAACATATTANPTADPGTGAPTVSLAPTNSPVTSAPSVSMSPTDVTNADCVVWTGCGSDSGAAQIALYVTAAIIAVATVV